MANQDFENQVLSAIEDLKRSNEHSISEVRHSISEVRHSISEVRQSVEDVRQSVGEVKQSNEHAIADVRQSIVDVRRSNEHAIEDVRQSIMDVKQSVGEVKQDTDLLKNGFGSVETNVAWVKGKLEGRQESISNRDARSAIWIALGSALAAIISLIKSFW